MARKTGGQSSNSKASHSVYLRWIALCVVLINLFVISIAALSLRSSRQRYEQQASITAQSLAQILDKNIAGEIDKIDMALLGVSDEFDRMTGSGGINGGRLNDFLARQLSRLPIMESLRIADNRGWVKYGPGVESAARTNISDREHFIRPHDGPDPGLFIGKPVFARISNKWVLPISRRLGRANGACAGVVYANVELAHFMRIFSVVDIGHHGGISLRDGTMGIIARYPAPEDIGSIIGNKIMSPELQKHLATDTASGTFVTPSSWDNVSKVVSYRRIINYPLYINVGIATEDYLSGWRKEAAILTALSGLFFLITLFSAWLLARYMTELRVTADSLKAAHVGLEQKVEERTVALDLANKALDRQLKFTRTLLETEPVAVFFKDTAGRYLGCNEEFSRFVGISPADLKGKTVFDLWPHELAERYHAQDGELLADPRRQAYEFTVRNAKGENRDVLFTKDVFHDEQEKLAGIIGAFVDITDRKQAEGNIASLNAELEHRVAGRTEQLRVAVDKLRSEIEERKRAEEDLKTNRIFLNNILDSIQDPLAVLDHNRNILLTNKTFEAAFGAGRSGEFLGKSCHEVLFGKADACGVCLAEQSSATGTASHKVISDSSGAGGMKWYDVFAYPLFTVDGRVVGNVHHLRDITEHRRAQERIAKNQEQLRSLTHQLLTSEERERKRISRELHDEMGQMLTGIKLSLQELKQHAGPELANKIASIQQDTGDLMLRARELSSRLRPSLLDDLGLLPALQWHIERFAKQSGVAVEFEHQGIDGTLSRETALTLFRVVQESLTNAVRHSGSNSVAIAVTARGGNAFALIKDSGVGFDPDDALSRGTTLGLAGMRERVEMAGGALTIKSARNTGTEISCKLPIGLRLFDDERSG